MVDSGSSKFGDSSVIELAGKILVITIILLFFFVVFIFCLHMYAKWFWYRRQQNNNSSANATGRRRLNFTTGAGHQEMTALRRGLDVSVLGAIPITLFDPKEFKDGLECAVCLSEVCEGEKARVLPKCNHGFHVECIDMWFQSHSTCPLCRNPVSNMDYSVDSSTLEISVIRIPGLPTEAPAHLPTNVLFCADEDHRAAIVEPSSNSVASTSNNMRDGELVIDVPREEEELKSPRRPSRIRSLKRLLSIRMSTMEQ